jgi:hypothetical protein
MRWPCTSQPPSRKLKATAEMRPRSIEWFSGNLSFREGPPLHRCASPQLVTIQFAVGRGLKPPADIESPSRLLGRSSRLTGLAQCRQSAGLLSFGQLRGHRATFTSAGRSCGYSCCPSQPRRGCRRAQWLSITDDRTGRPRPVHPCSPLGRCRPGSAPPRPAEPHG